MTVTRPALRWHGGKWLLAPWIISQFPKHRTYVEPYGGAASVLLRKDRSQCEAYNDLDTEVVNLFSVLRSDRANDLIEAVRLTPFARDEFRLAYEVSDDVVERARRTLVKSYMGFGSNAVHRKSGFRGNGLRAGTLPQHNWQGFPDALAAVCERFGGVVVENRDAIEVMATYDAADTLHYVDPPYILGTRGDNGQDYAHEMSVSDHQRLLFSLAELEGMVVLSGYAHSLYDDLLRNWRRVEKQTVADGARERTEVLWINPRCASRLDAEKLPLLDAAS